MCHRGVRFYYKATTSSSFSIESLILEFDSLSVKNTHKTFMSATDFQMSLKNQIKKEKQYNRFFYNS